MKKLTLTFLALAALVAGADSKIYIEGAGAEKLLVSVDVGGSKAFNDSLKRNLDFSSVFKLQNGAPIKVTGEVGGTVKVEGGGKVLTLPSKAADDRAARMEARALADKMVEIYTGGKQKGFAQDRIVFVAKKGPDNSELCLSYPDGYDMQQLTADRRTSVGPRWFGKNSIFYTGYLGGGPEIWEYNLSTRKRTRKWGFKGLATGATVSPDATRAAIILSVHGNPELYVIDIASGSWVRLTTTKAASEGQPSWSPDGRSIVYVSDETRRQHLYKIDAQTKAKKRLTSSGTQNVDPDWGRDGRIVYVTKRGGTNQIAVMESAEGDASATLVTEPGNWEHPSWARDGRHVVASRDDALYILDTVPVEKGGDAPKRLFNNSGRWITPSWQK